MSSALFRVVYFSKNAILSTSNDLVREINAILASAQKNNRERDVTGVLLFNNGVFGQVLEGPMEAVEDIFDDIQADARHDNVTVLEARAVEERAFPNWSMGYVGADGAEQAVFSAIGDLTDFDPSRLDAEAIFAQLTALARKHEVRLRAA